MGVGNDALEQREMEEIAFNRVRGAERVGERLRAFDAAVVHRAVKLLALHRESGAGSGERFARSHMGVEDLGDWRSAQ